MKRKTVKTIDGKEVVLLIPESKEDEETIEKLSEQGDIDTSESFADNFEDEQLDYD